VKILDKYVLKEHVGPLTFALTALTSLLLLNYVAKQFGNLVGKGLPWTVIAEFFMLSVPFTVAMTLPMAVLVSVLYAYSRLASENEITALKASGIGMVRMLVPVLLGASVLALAMIAFNDQVLPRANHRLRVLQGDIARKKPTFALREQVINEVSPGKLFLRAGHIEENSNIMREVTIYDLSDPTRRRTIYADSGNLALTSDGSTLELTLYDGAMQELPKSDPSQLQRLFYREDRIRVRGVGNSFARDTADNYKSDREMSICEMQQTVNSAERDLKAAEHELRETLIAAARTLATGQPARPTRYDRASHRRSLGRGYCRALAAAGVGPTEGDSTTQVPDPDSDAGTEAVSQLPRDRVKEMRRANPATTRVGERPPPPAFADPERRNPPGAAGVPRPVKIADLKKGPLQKGARPQRAAPPPSSGVVLDSMGAVVAGQLGDDEPPDAADGSDGDPGSKDGAVAEVRGSEIRSRLDRLRPPLPVVDPSQVGSRVDNVRARIEDSERTRDAYEVEIQKKFALAVACVVFVLLGAPIALRFPRGGVGLTIGVSLIVFALYYVGLIAGESLADRDILSPFWAMWAANVLFTAVGIVLLARMGREGSTSRGGDVTEFLDSLRAWVARQARRVGIPLERRHRTAAPSQGTA